VIILFLLRASGLLSAVRPRARQLHSNLAGGHRLRPVPHSRQWTAASGCLVPIPVTEAGASVPRG
jgi:hypothetical protein